MSFMLPSADRALEWCPDASALAAPIGLLFEEARALERLVLEGELQRGTHVRLEPLEQREGAVEELAHATQPVRGLRLVAAHRGQPLRDHRAHELAATGEVP